MFYSIKKSSKTRKEAANATLEAISDMETQLLKDAELMKQQKEAEGFARPSATSVRIAMPGVVTPRIKRIATEPVKRKESPGGTKSRLEEFKRLRQERTPRRPTTPRHGI